MVTRWSHKPKKIGSIPIHASKSSIINETREEAQMR